jgi:hypothetical protein
VYTESDDSGDDVSVMDEPLDPAASELLKRIKGMCSTAACVVECEWLLRKRALLRDCARQCTVSEQRIDG